MIYYLKDGNKIHIKKKNRGKFTAYCGGNVTSACIAKAKASGPEEREVQIPLLERGLLLLTTPDTSNIVLVEVQQKHLN